MVTRKIGRKKQRHNDKGGQEEKKRQNDSRRKKSGKNALTNQILDEFTTTGHIEQMDLFMRINEFLIANNLMNGLMSLSQKISTNCMCNFNIKK